MYFDLSMKLTTGVSLLDIRNCFKVIGFDNACTVRVATLLFENEVKMISDLLEPRHNSPCTRRDVEMYFSMANSDPKGRSGTQLGCNERLNKTRLVIEKLIALGLIEGSDDHYSITRNGHSLRMQKNLKRIPLKKSDDYLIKLLKVVEKINNENEYVNVDAILLFGSVIRKEATVGDIDLSVVLQPTDYCKRSKMDFYAIEREQKKVMKTLRISPYLSYIDIFNLINMYEEGSCKLNYLYLSNEFSLEFFVSKRTKFKLNTVNIPLYDLGSSK